jgi:hypothetical protein
MGQLTITFSGICTHFHDTIPLGTGDVKIPMRSVLPNALGIHFGMTQLPDPPNAPLQPMYYLMPHVAIVADAATTPVKSSYLYGAWLKVLNVDETKPPFSFTGEGYQLTDYVPGGIKPSQDVVQDYNAACYVDFFYGSGTVVKQGSSLTTVVTIDTLDDIPSVQIIPFPGSLMDAQDPWEVTGGELFVTNQDFDPVAEDKPFDFMLNYLTTFPGIPRFLSQNLPGMTEPLPVMTPRVLAESMTELTTAILSIGDTFPVPGKEMSSLAQLLASLILSTGVDLDASCSDSHYP